MRLAYATDLLERVPELVAGAVWVDHLDNTAANPEIDDLLSAAEALTRERFPDTPSIARFPAIAAWRGVYSRLGVKPNRYPCAAEALVRRVVETGRLPRISPLVDLCNALSVARAIPVAPFDLTHVEGDCTVRFASGADCFLAINGREPDIVPSGEVVYADATEDVLSRRWNWRQADKAKVTTASTALLITTEAVHERARENVEAVLVELAGRIPALLGGSARAELVVAGPAG
ncbi:MAG TPA: phenylalanine--tRNA ligase beta subunit-related protein [Thermomicrobiaceae bacterium]|nr:phenylalanine--tRNA ligase beta subunit-related protein [Thermomicrobiaceae bacterium]